MLVMHDGLIQKRSSTELHEPSTRIHHGYAFLGEHCASLQISLLLLK